MWGRFVQQDDASIREQPRNEVREQGLVEVMGNPKSKHDVEGALGKQRVETLGGRLEELGHAPIWRDAEERTLAVPP